jgi:hypothetical protein
VSHHYWQNSTWRTASAVTETACPWPQGVLGSSASRLHSTTAKIVKTRLNRRAPTLRHGTRHATRSSQRSRRCRSHSAVAVCHCLIETRRGDCLSRPSYDPDITDVDAVDTRTAIPIRFSRSRPPTTQHLRYRASRTWTVHCCNAPLTAPGSPLSCLPWNPSRISNVPCIRSTGLPPSRPIWLSRPAPRCNETNVNAGRRPFLRGRAFGQGRGKWGMSRQAALARCRPHSNQYSGTIVSVVPCSTPTKNWAVSVPAPVAPPALLRARAGVPTWMDGRASHVPAFQPLGMGHEGVLR